MPRASSTVLDSNDRLPAFDLQLVSGGSIRLPDDLREGYTVIFFYRGYW